MRAVCLGALALGAACQSPTPLKVTGGGLLAPDGGLAFPLTWVGYPTRLPLHLTNSALESISVSATATAPFSTSSPITLSAANGAVLTVEFAPVTSGAASGLLTLTSGSAMYTVPLSGEGASPPVCGMPPDCQSDAFSVDAGACVSGDLPDDTPCGAAQICLTGATCQGGECVGGSTDCNDDNVCTVDACDPTSGCIHIDQTNLCPPATGTCQVATCDPVNGCGTGPAPDGTLCGSFSCGSAQVCLSGNCVTAPTPDGFPCTPDYPCQPHGSCRNGMCSIPDAGGLAPTWTYQAADGGAITFEGLVDGDSNVYWLECGAGSCTLVSATLAGYLRYRVPLAAPDGGAPLPGPGSLILLGDDVIYVGTRRGALAVDSESGALRWFAALSGPDAGAQMLGQPVGEVIADGGERCVVPVSAGERDGGPGWITLDAQSGAVVAGAASPGPIASLVGDGMGSLWGVRRGESVGGATATATPPLLDLRATYGGWLYAAVDGGAVAIAPDAGTWQALGIVTPPLTSAGIAIDSVGGYVLGYADTDGGVLPSLLGLDPASAELTWLRVLAEDTSVTSPLLTSRESVVLVGAVPGAPWPWVTEVDANGDIPYVCALPTGSPMSLVAAALGAQTLFVQAGWGDGGTEMMALPMVGVSAALSGWAGPRGGDALLGAPL